MRSKAKTFCYVALGILALALAYHLGAKSAGASYVPPGESGIVATWGGALVLLENGEVWQFNIEGPWERSAPDPPVPVSEIKFWERDRVFTRSNEGWSWNQVTGEWTNQGPPPGLVATEPSRWGRVKAKFGE